MTYAAKGDRVFRLQDSNHPDCTPEIRRSDHRLKRFESIEDKRAWDYWEEPRATYLRDLMSGSQTCISIDDASHKYVPLEDLIRILMAEKDAKIKELEDRLRGRPKVGGKTGEDKPLEDKGKSQSPPQLESVIEERDKTRAMLREAMNKLQNIDVIVNENKSLQGRLKCTEERVKLLEEKKRRLEEELAELRSQSQIQVDLERAQRMLSDVSQKQENTAGMEETVLHNLSLERDELQEKVRILQKELEEARKKENEIEILKKKSESDSLDREEIARENECYKRKLASMKCLEKQIQELKKEGRALADKYKKEAQKATDQLNRMAQAANELQCLRDERDALRRRVNELASYEDQFNKLQKKLQRVDAVIAENENLNKKLNELQNLEKENENLKRRLEELKEVQMNAAEDKERILQLQCAVADQEEEMKDLLCQIERLTSGRIDEELDRLRCELSEKSSKLRLCEEQLAEIPMLEAEIDELRTKLQTCCKEFPEQKKSESRHQTLIVRLPSASKGIHVDYKTPEERSRTRSGPCTGERMKKAISDCKELMSCDDVQNLLQRSKGIISCVLEDMTRHQKEMEELELRNKNMKEEIEMLKEMIEDPDKSSMLKKIYELKKDLDEKDKQVWRLLRNEQEMSATKGLCKEFEKFKSQAKDDELPKEEEEKPEGPKQAPSEESRRLSELSDGDCCKYLRKKTDDLKLQIKALNKLTEQLKEENKLLRELQKPCPDFSKELDEKCALENLLSLLQAELDAFKGQKLSDECEALRNELKRVLEQNCQLKALVRCYKERLNLEKQTSELAKLERPEKEKAPPEFGKPKPTEEGEFPEEADRMAPEYLPGKREEEGPEYEAPGKEDLLISEDRLKGITPEEGKKPDEVGLAEPTDLELKPQKSGELEKIKGLPVQKSEKEIKPKALLDELETPEDLARGKEIGAPAEEEVPEGERKPEDLARLKEMGKPADEKTPEEKGKWEDLEKVRPFTEPTEEELEEKREELGKGRPTAVGREEEGPEEKGKSSDLEKVRPLAEPTEEELEEKGKPEDLGKARPSAVGREEKGLEEKPKPEDLAETKEIEELTEEEKRKKAEMERIRMMGKPPDIKPEEKPKPEDLAKAQQLAAPTDEAGPEEKRKAEGLEKARPSAVSGEEEGPEEKRKAEGLEKARPSAVSGEEEGPEKKRKPEGLEKARPSAVSGEEEGPEEKRKAEGLEKARPSAVSGEEEGPEKKRKPEDLAKARPSAVGREEKGPEEKPKPEDLGKARPSAVGREEKRPEDLAKAKEVGEPTEEEKQKEAEKERIRMMGKPPDVKPEEKPKPEDLAKAQQLATPRDEARPEEKPKPEDLGKARPSAVGREEKGPEEKPKPEDLAKARPSAVGREEKGPEEKPKPEDLAKARPSAVGREEKGPEEKPKPEDLAKARPSAIGRDEKGPEEKPKPEDLAKARPSAVGREEKGPEEKLKPEDLAKPKEVGEPTDEEKRKQAGVGKPGVVGRPSEAEPEGKPKPEDLAKAQGVPKPSEAGRAVDTETAGPKEAEQPRGGRAAPAGRGQAIQPAAAAGAAKEPEKPMTPEEELIFLRGEVKRLQQENDNLKKLLDAATKEGKGRGEAGRRAEAGGATAAAAARREGRGPSQVEEAPGEDISEELEKSRALLATVEAENEDKIRKLQAQHEKELTEREKAYNESVSALKSGYEGDIRKMADRHKSSVMRLQELHEDEVKDISSTHESQMGSVQSETQAALMDVAKGTAAKMKKLTDDHSREVKALKAELKRSQMELSELKKGKSGRGVSKESDSLSARHLREMQKMRMTSRQKLSAMKEKLEDERRRSSAEIETLKKQLKGQEGEGVCTCKFSRRPTIKPRDHGQALDFNEVLEKILEEGMDALTFNEIVLVHRKACCALQGIVMRYKQGPPLLELEPAVDEPCPHTPLLDADKQQLLSRIFALETEITRKQKQTQEAILGMEMAIKKERCRLLDVKNLLQNEQRKNSKLELLITSQTQFHSALRKERDELGSQASFNQTLCEEKSKQLEEEMKSKRCLEIEVEKLKGKLKQLCMAMDIERGSFNSQQRDKIEMMRVKMEEAIQNERKLGLQLERETKCRLYLQRQLQALRESLKHMVNLPDSNNSLQNSTSEDKSDKERRNLDQINQNKSKTKTTKPLKKHKK